MFSDSIVIILEIVDNTSICPQDNKINTNQIEAEPQIESTTLHITYKCLSYQENFYEIQLEIRNLIKSIKTQITEQARMDGSSNQLHSFITGSDVDQSTKRTKCQLVRWKPAECNIYLFHLFLFFQHDGLAQLVI